MRMTGALVLTNGIIWTGDSFARSVEILGGRIVSVDGPPPSGERVIDLRGRLVVPGFIDNHVHFVTAGLQLERLQLRGAKSADAFAETIARRASSIEKQRWITGGDWDEQQWSPASPPSREVIDRVAPDNPVFLTRMDLHMGVANSLGLRLAGITRETPDPPGGTIVRASNGEPTGLLKDTAMQLVTSIIPPVTLEDRIGAIRSGLREAARVGVTSFCDMGLSPEAFDDFRAFQRLDREGELSARVFMYLPIGDWQRLATAGIERGFGSPCLRIAGLKAFADGSLGSSTAAFREPYEGDPANSGLMMAPMLDGSMAEWVAGATARELQVAMHAIGDRANDAALTLIEEIPDHASRRFRIEHAQHLDETLPARFARARVIASVQPHHAVDDGRWAERKIGNARAAWAFPYRSLLDAGAIVTFGSDWPVAPLNPVATIDAAVNRRTLDGRNPDGWIPQQKVSVTEALRCYTRNNAWAVFSEREIGAIAPGMRADLAVLSGDLFTTSPSEIDELKVEMTIFDGRIIFEG
ncbi:MAG TPA: amidohydrolase [Thermoanaerobaculia bacterium]|nr:amidohydrolase [Thermoanaerobaculia bacterium]